MTEADSGREWLEADGLGGFASGCVDLVRTRRYHALLLTATTPPTGRMVLVNGFDAWVELPEGRVAISSQRYEPDVVFPDGRSRIESFSPDPWPTWIYRVTSDLRLRQEIVVIHDRPAVVITWQVLDSRVTPPNVRLIVRPFLSGRDYHATHHENAACRTTADRRSDDVVVWAPYEGLPAIVSRSNASYFHAPDWYRRFLYTMEQARGLDAVEDLMAPGWLTFDLGQGDAWWVLEARLSSSVDLREPSESASQLRSAERSRRAEFRSPLHRAADAFVVRRGTGRTIIAGYPWFTDWGRDTFLALGGLCLSSGRFNEARDILLEWSTKTSEGMLPNRFPDRGEAAEFNAVDASLWFVISVRDLCAAADRGEGTLGDTSRTALVDAVSHILTGYNTGTRFGIKADADGLLACGEPGIALTWMDARVDGKPVTPRIGKPIEVQALWMCALAFAARWDPRWHATLEQGRRAMNARFWNASRACLYDVIDVNHESGRVDGSLRPNQIFAIGGLGDVLVDRERARRALDVVERDLLTPMGLRTLARGEPGYVGHYEGSSRERDAGYHQGTAWPYLLGPFVEAWLAVHGNTSKRRQQAAERFLRPLAARVSEAGLGHLSELADAEPPHRPGGCPFQAWSMGALLRMTERLA